MSSINESGHYRTTIEKSLAFKRKGNHLISEGMIQDGLNCLQKSVEIAIFNTYEEGNWSLKIKTIVPFVAALLTHTRYIKNA